MRRKPGDPWEYKTDIGIITFDPIEKLFDPILNSLRNQERSAWDLEGPLAASFNVNETARQAKLKNGHRAWENHIAWALGRLSRRKRVTKLRNKSVPGGGCRGVYRITEPDRADVKGALALLDHLGTDEPARPGDEMESV